MGGRDKNAERRNEQLAQSQQSFAERLANEASARTAKMDTLQAPGLNFAKMAVDDPTKTMQVAMSPLSNVTRSQAAAKQNIFDSVPEGAARDFALSGVARDAPAQKAEVLNNTWLQNLQMLLAAGGEQGNFGLQQYGASTRYGEGANASNSVAMNAATQRKAATMGALGQAAGMAGQMAAGGTTGGKTLPGSEWGAT